MIIKCIHFCSWRVFSLRLNLLSFASIPFTLPTIICLHSHQHCKYCSRVAGPIFVSRKHVLELGLLSPIRHLCVLEKLQLEISSSESKKNCKKNRLTSVYWTISCRISNQHLHLFPVRWMELAIVPMSFSVYSMCFVFSSVLFIGPTSSPPHGCQNDAIRHTSTYG